MTARSSSEPIFTTRPAKLIVTNSSYRGIHGEGLVRGTANPRLLSRSSGKLFLGPPVLGMLFCGIGVLGGLLTASVREWRIIGVRGHSGGAWCPVHDGNGDGVVAKRQGRVSRQRAVSQSHAGVRGSRRCRRHRVIGRDDKQRTGTGVFGISNSPGAMGCGAVNTAAVSGCLPPRAPRCAAGR
jgi:hypothetical protein